MLRKDAIARVFINLVDERVAGTFERKGFRYNKKKSLFTKKVNGFEQKISISAFSVYFDNAIDKLLIQINFYFSVGNSKYEKWYFEKLATKINFNKNLGEYFSVAELNIELFDRYDFYVPTKSQQFKAFIANELRNDNYYISQNSLEVFLNEKLTFFLDNMNDYSNCLSIVEHEKKDFNIVNTNLLIFANELERATTSYQIIYQNWLEKLEEWRITTGTDNAYYLSEIKSLTKNAKEFLNLEFEIPDKLQVVSSKKDRNIQFTNTDLSFKELFTIDKLTRRLKSFCIDKTGRTIVGTENHNSTEIYVTIWDENGNLLLELELEHSEGFGEDSSHVGYLEDCDLFFANNYLINRNLECFKLEFPIQPSNGELLQALFMIPLVYDKEKELFITYYRYKTDKECYVVFYNKNYELVYKWQTKLRPLDIIPERKWIILYEYSTYISILDYEGNEIKQLPTTSVNDTNGQWNLNKYHAISNDKKYLFSFFYNTKSPIFDLDTFKYETLWGHPTYLKHYKELYYNDIHNNFDVHPAKFSPNNKYLVGGCEHGKYVAWTIPDMKRIELIPNDEFLAIMPDAEIFSINGTKYLKNRGHGVRDIEFYDNGKYFTLLINNHLLVWNDKFEHLSTIFDVGIFNLTGRLLLFHDEYLGILNNGDYTKRCELIILKRKP